MLAGACLRVIKVIYTQHISTHVSNWPSILVHVVLMSINICLRALYIMDNNVGAWQTYSSWGSYTQFCKRKPSRQGQHVQALLGFHTCTSAQLCKWSQSLRTLSLQRGCALEGRGQLGGQGPCFWTMGPCGGQTAMQMGCGVPWPNHFVYQ